MVLLILVESWFYVRIYQIFTFQYGSTYIDGDNTVTVNVDSFTFQYGSTYILQWIQK